MKEGLIFSLYRRALANAPRYRAKPKKPFHPTVNRWTGQPHEHRRERARHGRQSAKRPQ